MPSQRNAEWPTRLRSPSPTSRSAGRTARSRPSNRSGSNDPAATDADEALAIQVLDDATSWDASTEASVKKLANHADDGEDPSLTESVDQSGLDRHDQATDAEESSGGGGHRE